jgi:hypothetical protein
LRALYVIHNISFGGFDEVIEEPARSKLSKHRPRLPVNTESRNTDARLTDAMRRCAQRLADREATINHQLKGANTMADAKSTGQQTAAGYAKSNAPIPQSNHNPIPATGAADAIPTTGQPFDQPQFEVDRCPPGAGAPHDRLQFEVDQCPERP